MNKLPLGEKTPYIDRYEPTLLYPINRTPVRAQIGVTRPLLFKGWDLWNAYEFSWLSATGKPELRILEWAVNSDSENIVESKSVKLYLNSFHNSKFSNEQEVVSLINNDLTNALKSPVKVKMQTLDSYLDQKFTSFNGKCLDSLEINIDKFELDKTLLKNSRHSNDIIEETVYSNLLKANCLVTGQPDWGSVQISYKGHKIDESSILKYLLSFRNHNEFAEPACERIFTDLMNICKLNELTVYIRFTRRGGIDINPIRSTKHLALNEVSNLRHARQ